MKDDEDFGEGERVADQPVVKVPDQVDTQKVAMQVCQDNLIKRELPKTNCGVISCSFNLQRGHFFKSKHQSYVSLKRGVIKETKNKTTILSPIIYLALIIVYNSIAVHFQRVRFSF